MKKLTKKEKILVGVSLASLGVAGYLGIRHINIKKAQNTTNEELQFIKFLVIESDCVPKALQNAENKLTRKESKIKGIVDAMVKHPNDPELKAGLIKHEKEAGILREQISKTIQLQNLIDRDENIYAK